MSLRIRLSRGGAKKRPFYRIVVADSRSPRDGRFIEKIGTYDPMLPKDRTRVQLDTERAKFWLDRGALPTERCARFLAQHEMATWTTPNRPNKGKPKAKAQERMEAQRLAEEEKAKAAAAPAEEAAPAAEPEATPEAEAAPEGGDAGGADAEAGNAGEEAKAEG